MEVFCPFLWAAHRTVTLLDPEECIRIAREGDQLVVLLLIPTSAHNRPIIWHMSPPLPAMASGS